MESLDFAMLNFYEFRMGEGDDDTITAIILMLLDEEALSARISFLAPEKRETQTGSEEEISEFELKAISRLGVHDAILSGDLQLDDLLRYLDQHDSLVKIYGAFTGDVVLNEDNSLVNSPRQRFNWAVSRDFKSTLAFDSPQLADSHHEPVDLSEDGTTLLIRLPAGDRSTFQFGLGLLRIEALEPTTKELTTTDHLVGMWFNERTRNFQSDFKHALRPECIVGVRLAPIEASSQIGNKPALVAMIDDVFNSEETERRGLRPIIQKLIDELR